MQSEMTRAYTSIKTPKSGLLFGCEFFIVIATTVFSLLAGNALSPESSIGVAAATAIIFVFCYPRKMKLALLSDSKFMLLFAVIIAVFIVFIFRHEVTAYIAAMMFEECPRLLPGSVIIKAVFALNFLFAVTLFYLQIFVRSPLLVIIVSFIPLFSALYYENNTENITAKIGLIALVIVWIAQIIWQRNGFKNSFCQAFAFGIICMVIGVTIVYGIGYNPSEIKIEINPESEALLPKQTVEIKIETTDKVKGERRKWSEIIDESDGVSNLLTDGRLSFDHKPMLDVTMDFSAFEGSAVYLRHFFGADYNGKAWSELDADSKASLSEVISQFSSQNLYPNNLDSFSYSEFYKMYRYSAATMPFSIRKVSMDTDETFLPYLTDMNDEYFSSDGDIVNTETEYSGTINMPSGFYSSNEILNTILLGESITENSELQADELLYREYVLNTYMDVPQEFITQNPVFDDAYMSYITAEYITTGKSTLTSDQIFARKVNYIHKWLRDNCEYEINIDEKLADKDFVLYFLNESRQGFCQHFATASTLLCRAAGIPARYVTGFIIPESDYEDAPDGVVSVSDSRAHAWTEIYIDGYGWMPVDFTPGYSNVRTSLTAAKREQQNEPESSITPAEAPVTTVPSVNLPDEQASEPEPGLVAPQSAFDTDVFVMMAIFIPFGVIVIIVVFIVLRRRLMILMYAKKLSSEKGFDTMLSRTKYILNAEKLPVTKLLSDRTAYLKTVSGSCYGFVTPILEAALSVKFGGEKLSESQVHDLNKLLDDAVLIYYRKQKLIKRLKIKYILNLL
jgi:transglutaminase-like putative cysteine protease